MQMQGSVIAVSVLADRGGGSLNHCLPESLAKISKVSSIQTASLLELVNFTTRTCPRGESFSFPLACKIL